MTKPRLLLIQAAALGCDITERFPEAFSPLPFSFTPLTPVFPAVTCTAQASMRTGVDAWTHGMFSNGYYNRRLRKAFFWEQSAAQVAGKRIWEDFRSREGTVGMFCVQQSLGEAVDLVLSPAPIHKHSGGLVQDCYTRPSGLYADLCRKTGRRFNLFHYWGPLASFKSTRWITDATTALLNTPELAPDVLWTYLPHLDYGLQKYGPEHETKTRRAVHELAGCLRQLVAVAHRHHYEVLIWGDYSIAPANKPVRLNRTLRENGLFRVREVNGMEYPDLYHTPAVAIADHQVAHVYLNDSSISPAEVTQVLEQAEGVEQVWRTGEQSHPAAGDLIAVAEPGAWFSYKWWYNDRKGPDYASHMDIHNKIGFDPCELFFGRLPNRISMNDAKVKGTHGRTDRPAAYGGDIVAQTADISDTLDLSAYVKAYINDVSPQ